MAKDYTSIAETALRLVTEYGRAMSFVKYSKEVDYADKPWQGAVDVRQGDATTVSLPGISVSTAESVRLGIATKDSELVKQSEQILIVAPGSTELNDLSSFNEVLDNSVRWRITVVHKLQPAGMILLYYVGVKR